MNIVKKWDGVYRSSIRSKLENKKNSLQFLPQCLEEISKSKTFIFGGKNLKVSYVVDIIHNLILKYYFKRDNKFNISSVILREKYGHLYNYYIKYLVEKKFILMTSNYKKGERTRIYALNESILRGVIKRYRNLDKTILKKYRARISQVDEGGVKNKLIDDDIKTKLVNDLFYIQIEFDRSIFYLDSLKNEDNDIYNRNKYSVESINDNHIFYHFDSYGRLHTNFTILKSFIRKNCLLIDGEMTCEKDLKNSQPLFLYKLISEINSGWVKKPELELFRYLTIEGKYYQYIMTELGIANKVDAKELTYKVLFGRNGFNSKSDKLFSKIFPSIHRFIKLYKIEMGDYKVLAHELQRAESNLIFNKIIKEIITLYPEIKLATVHDSIIFPKKYKNIVESIFDKKVSEEFSIL